jgi:hypothetical protein
LNENSSSLKLERKLQCKMSRFTCFVLWATPCNFLCRQVHDNVAFVRRTPSSMLRRGKRVEEKVKGGKVKKN